MLSGSGLYDANVVKDRIRSARERDLVENNESGKGKGKTINVLALESAILDGKVPVFLKTRCQWFLSDTSFLARASCIGVINTGSRPQRFSICRNILHARW